MSSTEIPESKAFHVLYTDKRLAWLWLIIRVYMGYEWFFAGWVKIKNPAWVGANAGGAIKGFLSGALQKMTGSHPDVSAAYGYFIQHVALPNAVLFSYLVAFGEVLVGIALILGLFTGVAAFFGAFMNVNYLFAGTISTNPVMLLLQLLLILAWRTAGWVGLDRFVLPALGTPWQTGSLSKKKKAGRPL